MFPSEVSIVALDAAVWATAGTNVTHSNAAITPAARMLNFIVKTLRRMAASLRRRGRLPQAGRQTVGALQITLDAAIETFGDALTILGLLKRLFVGRIGDKGYLRQHGRHGDRIRQRGRRR